MDKKIVTTAQCLLVIKIEACNECSGKGEVKKSYKGGKPRAKPCPKCTDWRELSKECTMLLEYMSWPCLEGKLWHTVQTLRVLLERMGEFEGFVNRHLKWDIDMECDEYSGHSLPNLVDFVREITTDKGMATHVHTYLKGRLASWK